MSVSPDLKSSRITPTQILTTAATLVIIGAIGYALFAWRSVLIPVAIAMMTWFLISAFSYRLHMWTRLPIILCQIVALAVMVLAAWVVGRIIWGQFLAIQAEIPMYQTKLVRILTGVQQQFGTQVIDINKMIREIDIMPAVRAVAGTATGVLATTGLVFLYVILLWFEEHLFPKKIAAMFGEGEARRAAEQSLQQIQRRVQTYVSVKSFISLLTALCSYAIMLVAGVEHSIFWAFLIFLLNFIPNIGSIIAVTLPVLLTLVDTESWYTTSALGIALILVQQAFGGFIEPRLMGSSLNISPFVVLVSLTVWGGMWGLTGMLLCVPLTVIAMIVMAEFPNTRPIALLLSRDGNLNGRGD